jgi:iron complex transport system ATP-binding protein
LALGPPGAPFCLLGQDIGYQHQGREILSQVSLSLRAGQLIALVGPNGAGKTTLLRCLSGYFRPQCGQISLPGQETQAQSRLLAYLPQKSRPAVALSVYQAVLLGRRPYLRLRLTRQDRDAVAEALLKLEISNLASQPIDRISAGQYQRVRLARALAQATPGLLLDEPLNNLDPAHQLKVLHLLRAMTQKENKAILFSLHDLSLASRFAQTVILLSQGRVLASGPPHTVLTSPYLSQAYDMKIAVEELAGGMKVFIPQADELAAN